jgi:hypothetical protein
MPGVVSGAAGRYLHGLPALVASRQGVVIEVDGAHHYSDEGRPSPRKYPIWVQGLAGQPGHLPAVTINAELQVPVAGKRIWVQPRQGAKLIRFLRR